MGKIAADLQRSATATDSLGNAQVKLVLGVGDK
jgi:hypothetical protein